MPEKFRGNSDKKFRENYDKRFVNPYNFIPFNGKCERSVPKLRKDDNYTGYFDCRIKLLTPLFIPNTSSSSRLLTEEEKTDADCEKENWKGYDFFSYDDWSDVTSCNSPLPLPPANPVIPGSELRGAVRSVYEAAFNGCMSSVSADRSLSRRSNEAKKPGILKRENGEWIIHPCERAMLYVASENMTNSHRDMGIQIPRTEYKAWDEGQEIWIELNGDYIKKVGTRKIPIAKLIKGYKIIENSKVSECNEEKHAERENLKKEGFVQGWLHKGEAFSRKKHHESVFYNVDTSADKTIRVAYQSDIEGLGKILEEYRDPKKNRIQKGAKWYSSYQISPHGTLVYYSKTEEGHVYLSPACIGREASTKTIGELLKNNGGYEPCVSEELCPACQIFGMVGKSGGHGAYAYGSKVRVTDARLINPVEDRNKLFEKPIILPELGEPKPGAVEFYTKPPYNSSEKSDVGNGFWTYDYKYKVSNHTKEKQYLSKELPELRGRKFYWHSEVELKKYKDIPGNKINAMKQRIRPMKAGEQEGQPLFYFRLYFEQLSKQQLTELKWALDFGNTDCAHKIGRAKPLGFGSIRIIVDSLNLRKIDAETGAWEIEKQNLGCFFQEPVQWNKTMETIQKMTDWERKPENVRYPSVEMEQDEKGQKPNSNASHQWFTGNKGTISNPNFFKVLPEVNDDAEENLDQGKALYTLIKKK